MQTVTDSERPTPAATLFTETPTEETLRLLKGQVLELENDITKLVRSLRDTRHKLAGTNRSLASHIEFNFAQAARIESLEHAVGELRRERTAT